MNLKKLLTIFTAAMATMLLSSCGTVEMPVVSTYDITYRVHYPNEVDTVSHHIRYGINLYAASTGGSNNIISVEPDTIRTLYSSTAPYQVIRCDSVSYPRIKCKLFNREHILSVEQITYDDAMKRHQNKEIIIIKTRSGYKPVFKYTKIKEAETEGYFRSIIKLK